MLPEFINTITDLYEAYTKWVSENPQFVADIETSIKWASYFIAGRMNSSAIISELIYSWSNLLVLFNDRIIEKSLHTYVPSSSTKTKLKLLLTTLEYCEVFIELSAKQTWGEHGRWFFICTVQVVKCICRLLLTLHYKEAIVQSPPIKPLNRKHTEEQIKQGHTGMMGAEPQSSTYVLKRSKKVVRRVEGAPPIYLRNWKPVNANELNESKSDCETPSMTIAESIYVFKPLLHLGGISMFGYKSWRSYALALIIDGLSLHLYHKQRHILSQTQRMELAKRCVSLLLYLMRSPFYEKLSKNKINGILDTIGKNIPLTHMICNPLLAYIPLWQKTYFYMWSS